VVLLMKERRAWAECLLAECVRTCVWTVTRLRAEWLICHCQLSLVALSVIALSVRLSCCVSAGAATLMPPGHVISHRLTYSSTTLYIVT